MATVDELLNKQRDRLKKIAESETIPAPVARKKIHRTGPTRPWQENLPQYQAINAPEKAQLSGQEVQTQLNQSGHKVDTNRAQTEYRPNTEPDTNSAQTGHDEIPQRKSYPQTEHKVDTQPDTITDTKWTQTAHKPDTNYGFSSLVGLQREITVLIYESCKSSRARTTEALTLEHIASLLKIRLGSVKTTIRRLEEKNILKRVSYKNGRGGWSRYELIDELYRELLQLETEHKLRTNRTQTVHKVNTQPDTEPDTSLSSSSSLIELENLKTTTTGDQQKESGFQLSGDWVSLDFSPLTDIGFTQSHLIQLARDAKLSAQDVQNSISHFAFDLKRNGKGRELNGSAINFFMGILRKGIPYAPPENYVSAEDEERRKYQARMEQLREKRAAEIQAIWDLHFQEWEANLSAEECERILPEYARKPGPMRESCLKTHFSEKVWPDLRQSIPGIHSYLPYKPTLETVEGLGTSQLL